MWRRTERRERRRERRRREEREGGVEVEDCGAIPGDHRLEHFLLVRQQLLAPGRTGRRVWGRASLIIRSRSRSRSRSRTFGGCRHTTLWH